jgi:hypothetical protein
VSSMELSLAAAGVLDARSTTREGAERHGEAAQRRCYLTSSSCQTYSASSPHQRDSDSVACEVYIWRRRPPAASPRGRAPMAWPPRLQGRGRHATSVACMATFDSSSWLLSGRLLTRPSLRRPQDPRAGRAPMEAAPRRQVARIAISSLSP